MNGRRLPTGLWAVATGALIALSGCGGTAGGPAPTRAQYTARADAICRYEEQKLRRAAAIEHAQLVAFGRIPRLIREAVVIHEAATDRLERLREPVGEAARIRRWLTARTIASTLDRDAAEAPVHEYPVAAKDVEAALGTATTLERRLSRAYGLKVCGTTG